MWETTLQAEGTGEGMVFVSVSPGGCTRIPVTGSGLQSSGSYWLVIPILIVLVTFAFGAR